MTRTATLLASAFILAVPAGVAAQGLGAPADDTAPAIGAFAAEDDEAGAEAMPAATDEAEADPAPGAEEVPAGEEAAPGEEGEAPADAPEAEPQEPQPEAPALEPQMPEPEVMEIVRDTFEDWEVRCSPDGEECFLYQLAYDDEGNPVAEFSLIRLAAGEAAAGVTVVTPLGTLLPAGLIKQIDGGEARQYEFTFCSQIGCFARFGLTEDTVNRMKRGRVARLQLASIAAPDQPVELELSLMGFTAAYDSLTPVD